MTEWLPFRFSLSCIGEGNGNPLQCSCLENPRDGRAWWAAVYGVVQSQTQLKRLSSSSSRTLLFICFTYSAYMHAQLYATLCNPIDCSPSVSSVHGIFQARILENIQNDFKNLFSLFYFFCIIFNTIYAMILCLWIFICGTYLAVFLLPHNTDIIDMVFPIVLWEFDHKEDWVQKNWCFWIVML